DPWRTCAVLLAAVNVWFLGATRRTHGAACGFAAALTRATQRCRCPPRLRSWMERRLDAQIAEMHRNVQRAGQFPADVKAVESKVREISRLLQVTFGPRLF